MLDHFFATHPFVFVLILAAAILAAVREGWKGG
jgi:hypothetical protein